MRFEMNQTCSPEYQGKIFDIYLDDNEFVEDFERAMMYVLAELTWSVVYQNPRPGFYVWKAGDYAVATRVINDGHLQMVVMRYPASVFDIPTALVARMGSMSRDEESMCELRVEGAELYFGEDELEIVSIEAIG